ncbi:MAG: S9 family peptidase [Bacteroidales bacterium]|jgi:dipeptidyl-peptidase-4|nr:S9 family peptidase [Bacteroidales bacterium]
MLKKDRTTVLVAALTFCSVQILYSAPTVITQSESAETFQYPTVTKPFSIDSIFHSTSLKERKVVDFTRTGSKVVPDKYLYEIRENGFFRYLPNISSPQKKIDEKLLVSSARVNECVKKTWGLPKEYVLSSDKTKALFLYDVERIYRFSSKYYVIVWDFTKDTGFILGNDDAIDVSGEHTIKNKIINKKISYARFSPDSKKVAYTFDNNLYYYDLENGKQVEITSDGEAGRIINGRVDWVYEEEFQYVNRDFEAYIWSPNSKSIVFLRFDESEVKDALTEVWGELYTSIRSYKYPKAGTESAKVSIHLYNLSDTLILPVVFRKNDSIAYIFNLEWSESPDEFIVYTLNRSQNDFKVYAVAVPSSFSRLIYSEKEEKYSVTYNKKLIFLKDDSLQRYFVISDRSGYNHIYSFTMEGTPLKILESGQYDVEKIYGIDKKRKRIYFQAAYSKPYNREVLWVDFGGTAKEFVAPEIQNEGGWNDAYFNDDFTEMLLVHSTANTPSVSYQYAINDDGETLINIQENNSELRQLHKEFDFVSKDIDVLRTKTDSLYYWIMKPKNIKEGTKCPLLIYVYGGPAIQEVRNMYHREDIYLWSQYLVSQGYVVACVDNRGTPSRGREFEKCTYNRLGQLEVEDQFSAAHYFGSLPYIDSSRMGIWGWSYGGYIASLCLFNDKTPFKLAMAMAPISDWRFYDNIYTEHYLGFPQTNIEGYYRASLLNKTANMNGKYFLAHGTNDDNVHFQHTMELITALQRDGKFFDLLIFPNQNHYLREGNSEELLYKKMTEFLNKNL